VRFLLSVLIGLGGLGAIVGAAEAAKEPPLKQPSELFNMTSVWTVHLKFTAEQWAAMEPKGGNRGMFGGGRGGGPGGPGGGRGGGPGGRGGPGGPGGFGPAMFLAPMFMQQGDQNKDGKLSKDEFAGLGDKWFAASDKEKAGKINVEQLRAGLNTALMPAGPGGPGGGPGGGRGPGMNLQGAEGKRNGLASAAGVEFAYVHADLEFNGQVVKDVGVRYKGNGTWMQSQGTLKRSLKVDLKHFVKGQKLAGVSKLNFHNNVTDASWMNEVMSHRLYRDAGVPAPRTAYARVYVTVPGKYEKQYLGLYSIVQDIDKDFAQEDFHVKKGAIFKPVTPFLFADLGNDWAKYKQTYDPKTELSEQQTRRVMDFCKLVTSASDEEFAAKVEDYVDLEETARYMAVTVFLSTMDSILAIGQNFYVYLGPKTQKFQFLPWDLDHSFGQFPMIGSQEQRENLSIHHPWRGENRFLERLFKAEAFKKVYLGKLDEFNKTIFVPERFYKQVDEIAAAIRPAVKEESEDKLRRFNQVVGGGGESAAVGPGPNPPQAGQGGGGGIGGFIRGFMPGGNTKAIKQFVKARFQSVVDQVAGKSEGQELGGGGFGGPGNRGGGPGRGGPGGFGPGMFLGDVFMTAFDGNKDGQLTREEFAQGFGKWFEAWNSDKSGVLTEEQLRAGINKDLAPQRGGGPGGPPGGGGPGGPPPPGVP
jgi:spore coat protein CotH